MKVFASPNARKKIKEKKNQKDFWNLLYPNKDYVYPNENALDYGDKDYSVATSQEVVTARRKVSVPLKGILRQTEDGFVYVDISNDVIHGLFTLLGEDEVEKPSYFGEGKVGAHITVTDAKELGDQKFEDAGKEITFKLGKMYSVDPLGWEDVERVYFVEVFSSDIENIRKKYGLTKRKMKKGKSMEFHISFAVRYNK